MEYHLGCFLLRSKKAGCGLLTGVGGWVVVLDELARAADDEQARHLARSRPRNVIAAKTSVHRYRGALGRPDRDRVGHRGHRVPDVGSGRRLPRLAGPELAERAGDWLLAQAESAPAGIRWSLGPAYEARDALTGSAASRTSRTAPPGIGFFLARLAQVTGGRRGSSTPAWPGPSGS